MKKLLPILAISLCALLLLSLGRPIAANPSFPADGDTFEYDVAISMTGVNASTGPNYSETYSLDYDVEIINHTGDFFWANHTTTYPNDPIYYPYNGTTQGMGTAHYYPSTGIPLMYSPMDSSNWSAGVYPGWVSDFMFIESGTQPGDTITMGYGSHATGALPYSGYYTLFDMPVGPGTPLVVSGVTLSTVMVGLTYEDHYNSSNPTYTYWDMTAEFNVSWEWSLGYLAEVQFDIYLNLNPNYPPNLNLTNFNIEGSMTLVSADTDDPISPGPWEAAPAIPGFPIEAVLMGLFAALVPVVLIRKRRK